MSGNCGEQHFWWICLGSDATTNTIVTVNGEKIQVRYIYNENIAIVRQYNTKGRRPKKKVRN